MLTGLGVALGAAAVVATLALTATIRYQVSDEFDALLATQVDLRPARDQESVGHPTGELSESDQVVFPPRCGVA